MARLHGDYKFGGACRGGDSRIERDGGGDLRGAQPFQNFSEWRRPETPFRNEDWIHISRDIEAIVIAFLPARRTITRRLLAG